MATNHSIFETMLVEDGFTVQAAGYKKARNGCRLFLMQRTGIIPGI
ncbi:hypothetical protein [Acinetobacter kookii]|nr:hypothetical protein [Acinetobacter kookii]